MKLILLAVVLGVFIGCAYASKTTLSVGGKNIKTAYGKGEQLNMRIIREVSLNFMK